MGQFSNVLLAIDRARTLPQRALGCKLNLGGLDKVYGPDHPIPSAKRICGTYINIFTRCTNEKLWTVLY